MSFVLVNPEDGFTSDVIKDSRRFVGRADLVENCISALNASVGLIAVYGKRGVGKSSLLRQIQKMATGDYNIAQKAGLYHLIPPAPKRYYTVYYQCDSLIQDAKDLFLRLCNDTDQEDGLLRLVPDKGKEVVEFSRGEEANVGQDLKVVKWGAKGTDSEKYAHRVPNDTVQSFRNFVTSVVLHNNSFWSKRDSVLIVLDEFDQIQDKAGLGSIIKSLSSPTVKFAVCGIGADLSALMEDHASVGRLVQQGSLHVKPMDRGEVRAIFSTAKALFKDRIDFNQDVIDKIADICEGYPYFAQLIGKSCVEEGNRVGRNKIDGPILHAVLNKIRNGEAFPNLERSYSRAVGHSEDRASLLALLAEQSENESILDPSGSYVRLKEIRGIAKDLDVSHVDQNLPRLLEAQYGPVLTKDPDRQGVYEFVDPVFRAYVRLRKIGYG
ncbi:MAG TPA: AAA family ATPase [Falsiroseomonas sp.]|jgi:Cdc6-like AAA superfamily ATPase|nr:AAA family ATPase [Falsiroseomonas sp.]